MLLKLTNTATTVTIYQQDAVLLCRAKMDNGRTRKIWTTANTKIVTFGIGEDPEKFLGGSLDRSKIDRVRSWIKRQAGLIADAYVYNQRQGLIGGVPVVKQNAKIAKRYENEPGFIADAKIGEFLGVIKYARKGSTSGIAGRTKAGIDKVNVVTPWEAYESGSVIPPFLTALLSRG